MSDFNAGFRLSFTDIIVLIIGLSGAGFFYNINPLISAIVAFVLAHFFLFFSFPSSGLGMPILKLCLAFGAYKYKNKLALFAVTPSGAWQ